MALLEEVTGHLREVLRQTDHLAAALRDAAELARDAVDPVEQAGRGSVHEHEFTQAVDQWTEVVDGAVRMSGVVAAVRARVERILRTVAGDAAPSSPELEKPWVERHRARLPKYITSGRYVGPDGWVEVVQSGQEPDGVHLEIAAHLRGLGFPVNGRGRVTASEHVEGKVAWRQRASGVEHLELVINNEMCQGMYSCRKLVSFILRPGQTLVVHDPVTSRTFHGRSPL